IDMSYKVEELLALRDSVSESAVSLDKFADEEVIKEHVLRPSASATLATAASQRSLRASLTPAIATVAPYKKPSPSPSIKRGKAERLLKEHGSPPGMRVTAGGRVVPSDLQPLSNNRFINNTFKPQPTLRGAPVANIMPTQPRPDVGNGPRLEVIGNQPVLYVDGRAYALPALDSQSGSSVAPVATNMENTTKPPPPPPPPGLSAQSSFTKTPTAPPRANTITPFAGLDLPNLKAQQMLKKQELRAVEQTEVLQASHQTDAWRAGIIEKKRNLIIELDALRKQITSHEAADHNAATSQLNGFPGTTAPSTLSAPPFVSQFQQPLPSPMFGYPGAAPFPPMMVYPPFGGYPNIPPAEAAPFVPKPIQKPLSPGSASRRSHAVPIKPPQEDNRKHIASRLDPKSPTYEPVTKGSVNTIAPPTPSPNKRPSWRTDGASQSDKHEGQALSHKQSLSSIDTTDFFPMNTHEHSSTRVAPKATETTAERTAIPSTPEKNWPASPWNEGNSSHSSHKAVAKLTSWPEAFGNPPSVPSLRQGAPVQTPSTTQQRASLATSESQRSTFTSNMAACKTTEQRNGSDENWAPLNAKAINHVPSTYQEGYQAGYDHVGIPDSPDVLKGYIQGLLQFLSDESKKGRNGPLRGLVASSTPHDSAVNMSFNRVDAPIGSQENVRSIKSSSAIALAAVEKEGGKKHLDKGTVSRADSSLNGGAYPQQFSGNQFGAHPYGPSRATQRYHPSPKEMATNGLGAHNASSHGPFANRNFLGLDGAMDDLADMVTDTHVDDNASTAEGQQTTAADSCTDEDVSCFRPTSSKGKQKARSSPSRLVESERREEAAGSPGNTPGSPKKSGEHSPAKAKLEQVTNKFRRGKKDDPRNMSPSDKSKRSEKWHKRFQRLKEGELRDIERHVGNNGRNQ
ncbi:hypothetical protein P280DRAFT_407836, partial [Massarina eburnea CBS 473.64]